MTAGADGLLAGLVFGAGAVLLMGPSAIRGQGVCARAAFVSRFSIGFITPNLDVEGPTWLVGLVTGAALSLPDALVTKAFVPVLVIGAGGGLIVGAVGQAVVS